MTEAITTATTLTPIGAVLVLAALAQVAIVQTAKQQSWAKTRTQRVSLGVATVLGMIAGIPDTVVQAISGVLLSVAAVAMLGQTLYKVIGYVVPDGTDTQPTHRADG